MKDNIKSELYYNEQLDNSLVLNIRYIVIYIDYYLRFVSFLMIEGHRYRPT